MINILNFLKGKKSYIVGILTIILGILNGDTETIMLGLTAITLRAGITSSTK